MRDELLGPDEVATYLGTTAAALAQMRYRGVGPRFIKLGARSVRYRASDVDLWLERNTFTQTGGDRHPSGASR